MHFTFCHIHYCIYYFQTPTQFSDGYDPGFLKQCIACHMISASSGSVSTLEMSHERRKAGNSTKQHQNHTKIQLSKKTLRQKKNSKSPHQELIPNVSLLLYYFEKHTEVEPSKRGRGLQLGEKDMTGKRKRAKDTKLGQVLVIFPGPLGLTQKWNIQSFFLKQQKEQIQGRRLLKSMVQVQQHGRLLRFKSGANPT